MTALSTADRDRLADYLDGALGALDAGDFDHETALETVLYMMNAILDGDLERVRERLDELDEYAAFEAAEAAPAAAESAPDLTDEELKVLMNMLDGVLPYDAPALEEHRDSVGRRVA